MTIMHLYHRPCPLCVLQHPGYSNCTLHSTGNLLRLYAFSYLTRPHLVLAKHIDNVVAVLSSRPICQLIFTNRGPLEADIPATRPYQAT